MKAPRGPDGNPTFGFLPSPPPLPRIAARALVFCALAQRVEIEPPPGTDPETLAGTNDLLELSLEWLARHGLDTELTDAERAALRQPAGSLDPALRERFAHCGEAACVIAWALRRAALPAFDVDADAAAVAAALGWLDVTGATLGRSARLREREAVGAYLDAVGAVHWRLREQSRQSPAGADDAPAAVSMARWHPDRHAWPEAVTPLQLAADDDLAIGGRPVGRAPAVELLAGLQRLRQRHRATLWLLGQHRDYDAVRFNL